MMKSSLFCLFLFCCFNLVLGQEPQLTTPSFFADNMVLQQRDTVAIWGKDAPNQTVSVTGNWGEESVVVSNETGRWRANIATPKAGGPYTVSIKGSSTKTIKNVLIGEVWLCSGQSNMQMPVNGYTNQPIYGSLDALITAKNKNIRFFQVERKASVEPLDDVEGEWVSSSAYTLQEFSALAYFFGKNLNDVLDVPVALIHTSWGGSSAEAWTDKETLMNIDKETEFLTQVPEENVNKKPALLYNAMLHPFIGYGFKGIIWYQGESNVGRSSEYEKLFSSMITSWRQKWNKNFPFYFVQIAPYNYGDGSNSAFLREAQLKTMETLDKTGMAVTMDVGNCTNIHPGNKKTIADRLSYWALAKDYNIEGIPFSGPVFSEMEAEDHRLILQFKYAENGFYSENDELKGFEVAGSDKKFHPAQAIINRNKTITVSSEEVKKPVAVRYAFKNCIEGTLYNTYGLPASSFRTDSWAE
ncbi:sialate O-acetylesterase [Zunongwangia sp. F260]|uniref:Sialate O-acetylesterase n=1 Tax=Autumnicola lenta TaxID=3075593 RepID=A0ABU3CP74_9FLAO|nr:sialate O-acetylesterase [Zunongwangia sp. F260]MDT0648013.1 sialate O-acetylesterase [Zunongwangia sp. F260]